MPGQQQQKLYAWLLFKCERCWRLLPDVGTHAAHPTLCGRCADGVRTVCGRCADGVWRR
ncbi:MAG: hypothetical protein IPK32_07070 [Verrucomicrobiaceae bacterium]|nr:hypothetical protein [Verrucomicrobiaceae bacterium]